jgi:hypothetical protein
MKMNNSEIVGFLGEPNKKTGGRSIPISILYERHGIDFQFLSPLWDFTQNQIGFVTIYPKFNEEEKKVCSLCAKKASSYCGQCLIVGYCSENCQKIHWKVHKVHCKEYFKQK